MQIGRLRHKVTIYTPVYSDDGKGGKTLSSTTTETVYAEVKPTGGRERFYASQVDADTTHTVVLRYTANISHESWIMFGTRKLWVSSVRNIDERNRMLELRCREEVA